MDKEVEIKISQPMFEVGELEKFDNNIHDIVKEYSKLMFKEKNQILTQRIIMKQEKEIERLKEQCKQRDNIIKELEKWLLEKNKKKQKWYNEQLSTNDKRYFEENYLITLTMINVFFDKLQELKRRW